MDILVCARFASDWIQRHSVECRVIGLRAALPSAIKRWGKADFVAVITVVEAGNRADGFTGAVSECGRQGNGKWVLVRRDAGEAEVVDVISGYGLSRHSESFDELSAANALKCVGGERE